MNWREYFEAIALTISQKSKDPSTKVGAVIYGKDNSIQATGFNGFPRGVFDDPDWWPERYKRPDKYMWTEHAERNAIYSAAANGVSLKGSRIFTSMYPCSDCARAIIQTGIEQVVTRMPDNGRWDSHYEVSTQMFQEAGVEVIILED